MQKSIGTLTLVLLFLGAPAPLAAECGRALVQEDTLESILPQLEHRDAGTRLAAVRKLARLGDAGAVEPLIGVLDDSDQWVREEAARTLGVLGDARAVKPLIAALGHKTPSMRAAAAAGLGDIGHADAVAPLVAALASDEVVQREVIDALGSIYDTVNLDLNPWVIGLGIGYWF